MSSAPNFAMSAAKPLRRLVTVRSSNVDKITEEGEETVRLCNYVDVYYNDRITGDMDFSEGSATPHEITKFSLRAGDVIITKDSEAPDDIAVPALVDLSAEGVVCGYHLAVLRPREREVWGPYLFWSLMAKPTREAFGNVALGITRYGLTLNGISSVRIPAPDLNTQKAIASYLDRETARIDQLVAKKERQARLLNAKRGSIITAAVYGVSTAIPVADRTERPVRLRFVVSINPSKTEAGDLAKYGNVTFAPMDSLADGLGGLDTSLERPADELAATNYSYFAEGDLLLAKVTPCFENGKKAWVTELPTRIGFATSEVHVIRPNPARIDPSYLRYLLSSEPFKAAGIASMTGAGGLRRISDLAIKDFLLPIEDVENQKAIASFLDTETARIEKVRSLVLGSIARLREFRTALITAAVSGQIDVRQDAPATVTTPDRAKFRLIIGAEIVHRHQDTKRFGRIKNQKLLFLAEAHVGIHELGGNYVRFAAGPYDAGLIEETERAMEAASYFRAQPPGGDSRGVSYVALQKAGQHAAELDALLGDRAPGLRKLIDHLHDFETEAVEAIATLYAVWNDALMDGHQPDDDAIVRGVLTDWHRDKAKFTGNTLRHWLDWMKRHGLTPRGQGPRTVHTMTRDMFS